MTCQITELGLNGYNQDGLGRPRDLFVYARISGTCPTADIKVKLGPNAWVVFETSVFVDGNGLATAGFTLDEGVYPCGQRLWVSIECPGAGCSQGAWKNILCKQGAPGAGTPGEEGGESGNTGDWPWPAPPHIFCPLVGQAFTAMYAAALAVIVLGVSTADSIVTASGFAMIGIAIGMLAVWRNWCVPPECYIVGAMLWGLKRAVILSIAATFAAASVPTGLLTIALGACAGMCTAYLRKRRCSLPKLTTPMANLPVW